ncbi:hypothetical protein CEUSTIGMA_g8470.t1 [Chlamydomonas eustigma]|uniref:Uncharacterized protein n=1 Tax=Chlamydomonas eustigma TaxID=1157962 RepID=A0A250XD87_9CHLO|nr:hypothetical protein CEUSTIGMA_g8470.t1 [Chlamydomonas eustigma]|eukprot:GAX81035.1 hypothetical protein CEUSTIGMA_g8470.t1 [Chlamydomonas eustigma]
MLQRQSGSCQINSEAKSLEVKQEKSLCDPHDIGGKNGKRHTHSLTPFEHGSDSIACLLQGQQTGDITLNMIFPCQYFSSRCTCISCRALDWMYCLSEPSTREHYSSQLVGQPLYSMACTTLAAAARHGNSGMVTSLLNMLLSDHELEGRIEMGKEAENAPSRLREASSSTISQKDDMHLGLTAGFRAGISLSVGRRLSDTIITAFHGALLHGHEMIALQLFKMSVLGLYQQSTSRGGLTGSAWVAGDDALRSGHGGAGAGNGGMSCDERAGMLLAAAVRGRCLRILELLLLPLPEGAGLDVAACDHRAVRAAAALGDIDLVAYLVDMWGADAAARGEEALHAAIRRGDKSMACFLMGKRPASLQNSNS